MKILGISAYYHDSAAALVIDGQVRAAAQEERFSRRKHDARFPANAIEFCLSAMRVKPKDIDYVVFYDKPFLKFERLIETYLAFAPRGYLSFAKSFPIWIQNKLFLKSILRRNLKNMAGATGWRGELLFSEHHLSHAASAFFPSPFSAAAVLTMDGVGEWATTTAAVGRGNSLEITREINFPHSLGLLFSAFTYYTGFKVNSGEYKLMGLAPYGRPVFKTKILEHLIDLKDDGSFRLNMEYFDYCTGLRMVNDRFCDLFGAPPRQPDDTLTQHHKDIAASIQSVTEDVVLRLAAAIATETGQKNLCLAGGVALNCVVNGKLWKNGLFDRIWVQPAAGDAGGALGAALVAHHMFAGQSRNVDGNGRDGMHGALLGPEYTQSEIERQLGEAGAVFTRLSDDELYRTCVTGIIAGKALGWFQGRMEFGPRALGARSIIADARNPAMQSILNRKVKYRESFRPFAPAVLREDASDWFELIGESPYMLMVADVKHSRRCDHGAEDGEPRAPESLKAPRSVIPAVTHIDYSARVQTVAEVDNPRFYRLLQRFKDATGCPVLINTSFNVRGEPIVCTPRDAFRCFMGTEIELLAIGNAILFKSQQNPKLKIDYKAHFERD